MPVPPSREAWKKLDDIWKKHFKRRRAVREISKQPFFGGELPEEETVDIDVRLPLPAVQAIDDAVKFGIGITRVDPREMYETPIYTLEDICWNQMLDNVELSK